jgi:hypothetical protein
MGSVPASQKANRGAAGIDDETNRDVRTEPVEESVQTVESDGRSAKQAIAVTRKRCWQYDWVVEFDIKAAFDQIDHGLLLKAVRTHIKESMCTSHSLVLRFDRGRH